MGAVIFVSLYIFMTGIQLLSLSPHDFKLTNFQTQVIPLTSTWSGREDICISSGSTPAQKIWNLLIFILDILITIVIYFWLADLQGVLWPDSLRGQLAAQHSLCLLFFFLLFFSSVSPSTEISLPSLYNLDLLHHVTILIIQFNANYLFTQN